MNPDFKKGLQIAGRRLPHVSYNFLYSLLPSVFAVAVSYFVVRQNGVGIWGEYVYISSLISFLLLISQFGIKDQLLRDFSFNPQEIVTIWYQNASIRVIPLAIVSIVCFLTFSHENYIISSVWMISLWLGRIIEVFFIYQKKLKVLLFSEIIYWIVNAAIIAFYHQKISISILLWASLLGSLCKTLILGFAIRKIILPIPVSPFQWKFPMNGLTFFILALIGLLEARTDIFCINFILGKESVGKYSLLFSFLLLLKNIPDFFIGPFMKNFYRSNKKIFDKMNIQLSIAGLFISVIGVIVFRYMFEWFYQLHYSWFFYEMAILYVFPRFLFSMDIYRILQQKIEYVMVIGTLLGLAVNASLNFLWLKNHGIESVMLAAAIGQWAMLLFFKSIKRIFVGLLKSNIV